jgi:CysZ protein
LHKRSAAFVVGFRGVTTIPQTALVGAAQAPPRKPGAFSRFFGASAYPWKGIGFAFAHPKLLLFCAGPIATTVVAVILLFGGAWHLASSWAHGFAGDGFFGWLLFVFIMAFVVLAIGYVGFVAILALACAPFCAVLSDRTEALATGRPPPKHAIGTVLFEALRGIAHTLLRLAAYVAVSVPLYLLGIVLPPLSPIFVVLGMVITSYFLAYDFLDYPLSSRRHGFGQKWAFIAEHRAESLGFGAMVGLMLAIPLFNLVVAPFAAIGAALLHVELERP